MEHGDRIKWLSLECHPEHTDTDRRTPLTSIRTLRQILFVHARNLESFFLSRKTSGEFQGEPGELFPEPVPIGSIKLPKLRHLNFGKHELRLSLVKDLLEAAVNLETLLGFKLEMLDCTQVTNQRTVWTMNPRHEVDLPMENLEFDRTFEDLGPFLKFYGIGRDTTIMENTSTLAQVLQSSRDSLEKITISWPPGLLPGLQLRSKKVRDKYLDDWFPVSEPRGWGYPDFRMLPPGVKMSHKNIILLLSYFISMLRISGLPYLKYDMDSLV